MQKLPSNWKDRHFKANLWRQEQQGFRARKTPSDDSVQLLLKTFRVPTWNEKSMLRLLELSRNPALSATDIAEILTEEFDGSFTYGAVLSRLKALREAETGVKKVGWGKAPAEGRRISATSGEES